MPHHTDFLAETRFYPKRCLRRPRRGTPALRARHERGRRAEPGAPLRRTRQDGHQDVRYLVRQQPSGFGRRRPRPPRLGPWHQLFRHRRELFLGGIGDHHRQSTQGQAPQGLHCVQNARGAKRQKSVDDALFRAKPAETPDRLCGRLLQPRGKRRGQDEQPRVARVHGAREKTGENPLFRHVGPRGQPDRVPRLLHRQRAPWTCIS